MFKSGIEVISDDHDLMHDLAAKKILGGLNDTVRERDAVDEKASMSRGRDELEEPIDAPLLDARLPIPLPDLGFQCQHTGSFQHVLPFASSGVGSSRSGRKQHVCTA